MTKTARICAAQTPEFIEDVPSATAYLKDLSEAAIGQGASLLVFPEGFLQGYIVEERRARDIAFNVASSDFEKTLQSFPKTELTIVVGIIEVEDGNLFNTAIIVRQRALVGQYRKMHLLKSERAFTPGTRCPVFDVGEFKFGVNICYDANFPDPSKEASRAGASLIACCANNMLRRKTAEEYKERHNAIRGERCREAGLWMISSDVTGEREGKVSWGPTSVIAPDGTVMKQLPLGERGLLGFDLPLGTVGVETKLKADETGKTAIALGSLRR
ncbi:carbon-nitrogen hydrolase family protein [Hoeflea prorocentri]|uniref:Carbon-nitrogen hydrolase family protein n=1 Tax=Hoeflea prorocentri TaxID=1922333 RepID=A0A9X3UJX3_9HYPH|nr:carbon-nitrogen hydrolase family protein [Hoeflea prorocentri]MCY6382713.1 carbon-nitrogen hydrolase family protein [Hoeflea prorocentri]MDA5400513.1 carbon-nitrogen hydrolase family protein [Hoeflea prorocentri]